MPKIINQYEQALHHVLTHGTPTPDRTEVGTISVFGYEMRFNLNDGFPLVTTKHVHFHSVVGELLWFLRGDTNTDFLHQHNITIWDEWATPDGDLGPIYGKQWRSWDTQDGPSIDQISRLISNIVTDPHSRRHVVSAWNVADLERMALSPCHAFMQFHVSNNKLSCKLTQRSADMFLGVPFNIASYALLTHMVAQQTNLGVGDFIWSGGDCHVYSNHVEQVHKQLAREPREAPTLILDKAPTIFDYTQQHIHLEGYNPHPPIPARVAV